jgi:hypothetical protein
MRIAGKKSYFPNPYFLLIIRAVFRGYFFSEKNFGAGLQARILKEN